MERLFPESTLLLLVDVQERLAAAMPPARMELLTANASILLDAAARLGVKTLASEQYPKGLGPTLPPLATRLHGMASAPIAKTEFDACGDPAIARVIASMAPRAVVVLGMETHVCVFQTARELVRRGYATYVVADAVASRREENREAGLSLCERAGAVVTVTETVVFDWVKCAGTEDFKAISKLVK
jgi:nicotinamidase-related amidase